MDAKKPAYKNHFVSYKPSRAGSVISYKRNNLLPSDFKRTSDGFIFREEYNFKGLDISIGIKLEGEDVLDILKFPGTDFLRISGTDKHIGILLLVPERAVPFARSGSIGNISYSVKASGYTGKLSAEKPVKKTSLTKHLKKKAKAGK